MASKRGPVSHNPVNMQASVQEVQKWKLKRPINILQRNIRRLRGAARIFWEG